MTEIRCKKCNRLLMKAEKIYAEIKCPKCGYKNLIMSHMLGFKIWNADEIGFIEISSKH